MKKFLNILLNIVITIVVILAVSMTLVSLSTAEDGITHIGKYIPLNIQTASMEPYIMAHDMIVAEEVKTEDIKEGDVIVFKAEEQDTVILKTHRVIKVNNENGSINFTTRGDNNDTEDPEPAYVGNIVGIYKGIRIPIIGLLLNFLQSQIGFLICIVLPLFVLFIYQLYKFIVTIMEEKNKDIIEKTKQASGITPKEENPEEVKVEEPKKEVEQQEIKEARIVDKEEMKKQQEQKEEPKEPEIKEENTPVDEEDEVI